MFKKLLALLIILSSNVHASTATGVSLQYSTASVTTSAYTEILNKLPLASQQISVFDSSGQSISLAVGTTSFEVQQIIIPPGGGDFPLNISAGSRISIKGSTGAPVSGLNITNFFFN